jgi:linoleoyl-CoA desaturase
MNKIKFVDPAQRRFFQELKSRVDKHFRDRQIVPRANTSMVVKTVVLLAWYLVPFVLLVTLPLAWWAVLLLWVVMGLGVAGIGMGVMHDANHGSYSEHGWVNRLLGYSLNLLGASAYNWKLQHNVLHHTFTNVVPMDEDIADKAGLRFSPHTPLKSHHRYQWVLAPAIYALTTLYWVLAKDFMQFVRYLKKGVILDKPARAGWAFFKIVSVKVLYFLVILGVPLYIANHEPAIVWTGFLMMHLVAGLVLTLVFQLAHTVEGTTYPQADANGCIQNEWAIHQMNTTANFSPGNKIITWFCGGLNYQVEHHLFPHVCHVHYPEIAPIVRATAQEFGIPYLENKTLGQALKAHFGALRQFGRLPDMDAVFG